MTERLYPALAGGTLRYLDSGGSHAVVLEAASTSVCRSQQQDIVLDDPKVSRLHALILRDQRRYTVIDQGSTRGTFLKGEPLAGDSQAWRCASVRLADRPEGPLR